MRKYEPAKSHTPISSTGTGGIAIPSPQSRAIGQLRTLIDASETTAARRDFQDAANGDVVQRVENTQFLLNRQFTTDASELSGRELSEESSLDMAAHSVSRATGLAYVINCIVSYHELDDLPAVVAAMTESLADDLNRIALVIGVNAPKSEEAALHAALDAASDTIDELGFAVALVPLTFEGAFPYGTMRNQVLHSDETRAMTEYFVHLGLHPYVSIQDFDTGSRRVGDSQIGQHVFHALDALLANMEDDDSADIGMQGIESSFASGDLHDEDVIPEEDDESHLGMLPLMIAGGYRAVSGPDLKERTSRRLAKVKKEPSDKELEEHLAGFVPAIAEDMAHRQHYARLHPLLPYAPEPNLFLDATAVMRGSPRGTPLLFGSGGAEFTEMGKNVNRFAADELEAHFTHAHDTGALSLDAARNQLMVHAANQRHPVRGTSFMADYANLNVETDLSRLAASAYTDARTAQSHVGLTTLVDRFYNTKDDKTGAQATVARDKFSKTISSHPHISPDLMGIGPGSFKIGKRMSQALSIPYGKDSQFSGLHHGVPPSLKKDFLYQTAIETERVAYLDQQVQQHHALIDNFKTNAFALHGAPGVQLAVSHWTVANGDCGVYALGRLWGQPDITRTNLIAHLRSLNTDEATAAANRISGFNATLWLSHDDLTIIGQLLGFADIAIVTFNLSLNQWAIVHGNPSTSTHIIGGVPASLGGPINHWVVLQRS